MKEFYGLWISVFLFVVVGASAQDTIPVSMTPSVTPTFFNQSRLLKSIKSPNNMRLDVYDKNTKDKVGIPSNYAGVQEAPPKCDNYLGISTYNGPVTFNLKEKLEYGIVNSQFNETGFIQVELPKNLGEDKEYDVTFKLSLADNSHFATSGWGAYFYDAELKEITNLAAIKPQVSYTETIKNKLDWVQMKGKYKTTGHEKFMMIGCFETNYQVVEVIGGYGFGNTKAYYYVSDIKLIEIPSDIDKDGVIDIKDRCPDVFGLAMYGGCPDTDGDSIPDPDDVCPVIKGLMAFNGCPDTDGDGLEDGKDKCPNVFGKASEGGCPVEVVYDEISIMALVRTIQFEPESEELKVASRNVLDNIATALKNNPTLTIAIGNFVDEGADPKKSKKLSAKRASSIIVYLVNKGVDAKLVEYIGNNYKNENAQTTGGRRIEFEVTNPK